MKFFWKMFCFFFVTTWILAPKIRKNCVVYSNFWIKMYLNFWIQIYLNFSSKIYLNFPFRICIQIFLARKLNSFTLILSTYFRKRGVCSKVARLAQIIFGGKVQKSIFYRYESKVIFIIIICLRLIIDKY